MHPYVEILGRSIPTYWLCGMGGCMAAALYAFFTNKRGRAGHIPADDLLHIIVLSLAGALIGAKLLYFITILPTLIENWQYLSGHPSTLYELLLNGMVFYGGVFGAAAAMAWYCRKYSVSSSNMLGVVIPAIPLLHAFGRVGCFFAGCCWGREVPWGIAFTHAIAAPNHVPLFPVQLAEAACNLCIFAALSIIARKASRKWLVLPFYVLLYGGVRFVLEFFRGDDIRGIAALSTSQWISIALCLGAIAFLLYKRDASHAKATDAE